MLKYFFRLSGQSCNKSSEGEFQGLQVLPTKIIGQCLFCPTDEKFTGIHLWACHRKSVFKDVIIRKGFMNDTASMPWRPIPNEINPVSRNLITDFVQKCYGILGIEPRSLHGNDLSQRPNNGSIKQNFVFTRRMGINLCRFTFEEPAFPREGILLNRTFVNIYRNTVRRSFFFQFFKVFGKPALFFRICLCKSLPRLFVSETQKMEVFPCGLYRDFFPVMLPDPGSDRLSGPSSFFNAAFSWMAKNSLFQFLKLLFVEDSAGVSFPIRSEAVYSETIEIMNPLRDGYPAFAGLSSDCHSGFTGGDKMKSEQTHSEVPVIRIEGSVQKSFCCFSPERIDLQNGCYSA